MSAFTQLMQKEERKIGEMELDELRPMLCQLHGQDPTCCMDCKGVDGCPAGKRAVELLEEYTRADKVEPAEPKQGGAMLRRARLLADMEDPVTYLCEEQGKTYHHATELVRSCCKFYPEIMAKIQLPDRTTSNIGESERLMREVLQAEDPVQYMLDRYHIPRIRGRILVEKAREKWGEQKVEDEMSVDDFIQTLEPAAPEPEKYELTDKEVDIYGELNAKFYALDKREAEIREQMQKLEADLKWIEKSKEAIALVTNLFNPNSAIGKSLITE